MKLRSESRAAAAYATPIPFLLPETQAITVRNASSPLLRIPQELKDRIYQFVYGGFYIRVLDDNPCFGADPIPYMAPFKKFGYHGVGRCTYDGMEHLPVASLGTCRQLYHEAKNVLYSANEFSVAQPKMVNILIRHLDSLNHRSLAVRSVYLHAIVYNTKNEREWDNTFRVLAEGLKNLRHIRIFVGEYIWNGYHTRRQSPAQGKRPFLQGLLELKKLPLKTIKLIMNNDGGAGGRRGDAYDWTDAQKREWAQKMEGAILGSG